MHLTTTTHGLSCNNTRTVLQKIETNHLGLRRNALPWQLKRKPVITSGRACLFQTLRITDGPNMLIQLTDTGTAGDLMVSGTVECVNSNVDCSHGLWSNIMALITSECG